MGVGRAPEAEVDDLAFPALPGEVLTGRLRGVDAGDETLEGVLQRPSAQVVNGFGMVEGRTEPVDAVMSYDAAVAAGAAGKEVSAVAVSFPGVDQAVAVFLQGQASLRIRLLKLDDLGRRQPFIEDFQVSCWIAVVPEMEHGVEAIIILGILPAEPPDLLEFMNIGPQNHRLEPHRNGIFPDQFHPPHESREGTLDPGYLLVGFRRDAVDRYLDIPRRIFLEEFDMLSGDERGVGEERQQQALLLQGEINVEKILTQQRLPSGEQTPQGAEPHGFVRNLLDLRQ